MRFVIKLRLAVVLLLLCLLVGMSVVSSLTVYVGPTRDTSVTFIQCSNGNIYEATGNNLY